MRRPAQSLFASLAIAAFLAGAPAWAAEPPTAPEAVAGRRPPAAGAAGETGRAAAENARGRARRSLRAACRLQGRGRDRGDYHPASAQLFRIRLGHRRSSASAGAAGDRGRATIPMRSKSSTRRSRSCRNGRKAGTPARPRATSTTTITARWPTSRRRSSASPSTSARSWAWATILEARGKREEALKVYERALGDRAALAQRPGGGRQAQGRAGRQRALAPSRRKAEAGRVRVCNSARDPIFSIR